jgi:predicted DNA-binding transcriptional regulator YafY
MGARAAGKVTRRKTVVDVGAGAGKGPSGHQAKQQGKIRRLLVMLSLLRSAEAMTPAKLAERLGVNTRQITRDLKELTQLGFKIEYDRAARRYNISGGIFMPPLELEAEEAFALVLLAEQVAGKHQVDHLGPAATAIAKITSTLPDSVRKEVESSRGKVQIRATMGGEEGPHDLYDGFRRAVAEGTAMQCRYDSARGMQEQKPGEEFVLRPYALLFHLRAWYVVGYNQERGQVRMYKISRFRKAAATKERYTTPADFSLDKYLGNAWRVITDKQDHEVELLFSKEMAPTITETRWHKTEETQENADGTVTYRFTVSGLTEISWWILGYGPMVKVVRPKELAELVAKQARRAAEQYG